VKIDASPVAFNNLVAASKPALPVLSSPKIMPSEVIFRVAPIYPTEARLRGIDGTVVLTATVTKNGSVSNVRALKGTPSLCNAAMDALKQWRYKPSLMNGVPVDSTVEVVFHFHAS
jgi:protein TonB